MIPSISTKEDAEDLVLRMHKFLKFLELKGEEKNLTGPYLYSYSQKAIRKVF